MSKTVCFKNQVKIILKLIGSSKAGRKAKRTSKINNKTEKTSPFKPYRAVCPPR